MRLEVVQVSMDGSYRGTLCVEWSVHTRLPYVIDSFKAQQNRQVGFRSRARGTDPPPMLHCGARRFPPDVNWSKIGESVRPAQDLPLAVDERRGKFQLQGLALTSGCL